MSARGSHAEVLQGGDSFRQAPSPRRGPIPVEWMNEPNRWAMCCWCRERGLFQAEGTAEARRAGGHLRGATVCCGPCEGLWDFEGEGPGREGWVTTTLNLRTTGGTGGQHGEVGILERSFSLPLHRSQNNRGDSGVFLICTWSCILYLPGLSLGRGSVGWGGVRGLQTRE